MTRLISFVCSVIVLSTVLITAAYTVHAQGLSREISNGQANAFYSQCMENEHPAMSPDTQIYFCSCATAQLKEKLWEDDLQGLESDSERTRLMAERRVVIYAYTPCLNEPLQELTFDECIANPTFKGRRNTEYCQCMRKRSSMFIDQLGIKTMSDILKRRTETIGDPFITLLESDAFNNKREEIQRICRRLNSPRPQPPRQNRKREFNQGYQPIAPLRDRYNQ